MLNIITWVLFSSLFWLHGPKQCRPIKPADSCSQLTNSGKFLLLYLPKAKWQTAKVNQWSWCLCQSFGKVRQEKHLCQNVDISNVFLCAGNMQCLPEQVNLSNIARKSFRLWCYREFIWSFQACYLNQWLHLCGLKLQQYQKPWALVDGITWEVIDLLCSDPKTQTTLQNMLKPASVLSSKTSQRSKHKLCAIAEIIFISWAAYITFNFVLLAHFCIH